MSGVLAHIPAIAVWPVVAIEVLTIGIALAQRRSLNMARGATVAALGLYTAAVLSLTLFPMQVATGQYANQTPWTSKVNFIPLITADASSFALNILLLAPLGALIPLLRRDATWRTAATAGFVGSGIIEATQLVTDVVISAGRTADVNDLIANTVGALVGFSVAALTMRIPAVRELRDRYALWSPRRGDAVVG